MQVRKVSWMHGPLPGGSQVQDGWPEGGREQASATVFSLDYLEMAVAKAQLVTIQVRSVWWYMGEATWVRPCLEARGASNCVQLVL